MKQPDSAEYLADLWIRFWNEAVSHYQMHTPKGPIQVCDRVVVRDGQITEIHSFCDATGLR